jgi:hypothetical protein
MTKIKTGIATKNRMTKPRMAIATPELLIG